MPAFKIKDPALAPAGRAKIAWAERTMPVLLQLRAEFQKTRPFAGKRIAACLHVTKETGVLAETLKAGGADVFLCGSNPLSTQDDVAAALAQNGVHVFAWRGVTNADYYRCLNWCLDAKPHVTIDDGADLITLLHGKRRDALENVVGGQEETTTGVVRLKALAKDGKLRYPVVAVNNAKTKRMFDNRFGTGQSTVDGIVRATDVLLAGKNFVVAGFGWCGRGLADRARGMGANVIVTEVDAVKALEARMMGFRVLPMADAARVADVVVTATGDVDVLTKRHFPLLPDGAILANTGHFNVEINLSQLRALATRVRTVRPEVEEFALKNGRRVYVLAQGRLVNLACATGHPSEVMDMSFANQALVARHLVQNAGELENRVYDVPDEIDARVARLKLAALGVKIDALSAAQKKYLASWSEGT